MNAVEQLARHSLDDLTTLLEDTGELIRALRETTQTPQRREELAGQLELRTQVVRAIVQRAEADGILW